MRLGLWLVVVTTAGCVNETGLMLEVTGPGDRTSVAAGITKLDFVVAHPSWCDPWVGAGSTSGCDTRVITSFDRLVATAGCELTPKGAPLPVPVCDGQPYPNEANDRAMPCWAADPGGGCRMTARNCRDTNGVGFVEECTTGSNDALLPSADLVSRP